MKTSPLVLILVMLISHTLLAATNESSSSISSLSNINEENPSHWSIGTSLMAGTYTLTSGEQSGSSYKVSPPLNIGAGYQSSISHSFGWAAFANLASLQDNTLERNVIFMRVDIAAQIQLPQNLAFNIGPTVSRRFGGGRFSKSFQDLIRSHGLGYKIAFAKEISSIAAIEFGYSETAVPIKDGPSFQFRGPEFGFKYLF